ncbi:MAG TPA: bifunctional pyr operon transcriptional regulator/uracil phosphoribosyltransferase PyrR [Deltaproteobacteria bacterium]|nr:MAG: bifunctional pyr operon transcriptional regulator/uracil phosphoribosyltransferase [Deltaproteobacteria bacterium GWA2_55_82]OGQ63248.1 MAG: bifunctional pyr operon transcriptional regulator/uracil phosphoribosyltransferase [Deltaproteobacteria bacterium RIFCSPLOWO2_02_FULL_55_12]OIJ73083.1 MAG: bifunctional pyr operon transcriptional regulator/uracil phosphoribosyltransferase [Deltaproteobacteria bacterium GWC2_55_46]HBG47845.1 bifunctional pyr operon transcriptional regulator/uracil ph
MKKTVLDDKAIDRALARIAHEILERNKGTEKLVILGIPTRGYHLALRLQKKIEEIEGVSLPAGAVDATLYRDDLGIKKDQPSLKKMEIPISIDGMKIIMVDDVLFTGRTIRAAMNALMDFGRPIAIQLAVLVDRGHRELPIKADYVGKNIPTSVKEGVKVHLEEIDGVSEVVVEAPEAKQEQG